MLTVALAGCGGGEPPRILIGHVTPLSGPDKHIGTSAKRGVRLAVEQTNEDAGVDVPRIVVLHANAGDGPQSMTAEAVRLLRVNKTAALLGGWDEPQVEALRRESAPLVSPSGFAGGGRKSTVYLTGLTPQKKGELLADALFRRLQSAKDDKKPKRIVAIVDGRRDAFTVSADAFVQRIATRNKKTPNIILNPPQRMRYLNDRELTTLLKRLDDDPPAALFIAGAKESVLQARTHNSLKATPIAFAGREGADQTLFTNPRTRTDVLLATAWTIDIDHAENRRFRKAYKEAYTEEPDVHAALAHDAARILIRALQSCGRTPTLENVQAELDEAEDVQLLTGKGSINDDRILERPGFVVEFRNGKVRVVGD